jgi:hypothetical protein
MEIKNALLIGLALLIGFTLSGCGKCCKDRTVAQHTTKHDVRHMFAK